MRDPFAWSIPLGRLFGITIRVHLLFPVVAVGLLLRAAYQGENPPPGRWIDYAIVIAVLFVSVLLHEFGHCFAARFMNGDANEVLLWPLGGLAKCEVPHTARANFVLAIGGPAVNILLLIVSGSLLYLLFEPALLPPLDPRYCLARGAEGQILLHTWSGGAQGFSPYSYQALLSHLFWANWFLALINLLLVGFPFDAGHMLQSVLWNYLGYRQATLVAVFAGFATMFLVGVYSIFAQEVLALALCIFIYVSCKHQWLILETGGEESLFGYDFSQGYTSLERDQPAALVPPRPNWWQRWRQRRTTRKLQREMERREAEEHRMDQLLEKISLLGMNALSDEERRFMKQFSDRYKNRHQ